MTVKKIAYTRNKIVISLLFYSLINILILNFSFAAPIKSVFVYGYADTNSKNCNIDMNSALSSAQAELRGNNINVAYNFDKRMAINGKIISFYISIITWKVSNNFCIAELHTTWKTLGTAIFDKKFYYTAVNLFPNGVLIGNYPISIQGTIDQNIKQFIDDGISKIAKLN
jgi:hypothetical protein